MGDPAARWAVPMAVWPYAAPSAAWPNAVPLAALPYVLLVFLAAVTVAERRAEGASPLIDLVLCVLMAAWMPGAHTLYRRARREHAPVMAAFVAVLVLLMGILVLRSPWFGFFTPVGYVCAFRLLRWPWQPLGVGAVAVVAGTAQAYGIDTSTSAGAVTYGAVVAANVVPMCAYAWIARRAARQNEERERALREAREANRRLAASLADNAVLHEQLLVQARDAGVRDERQRMAREIHDTLAQGLTGIISQLRAAEHAADDPGPAGWRRHVVTATRLAGESLSEARRSVHALRPEPLESARLGEALAGVAGRWSELHGIPVQVTTTGTARPIGPEAEVALLRIAQEALSNVAKHAGAGRVGVTLSYLEHEAALDVRDDGGGFDPARLPTAVDGPRADLGGFGLTAMRQRIESLSGTLQVESEPGAGTGISARVPTERAEARA